MKKLPYVLTLLFAALLIVAGINHFINPGIYSAFIPDWMSLLWSNVFIGAVEVGLGAGLLFKKQRKLAALGVLILMILFLPLHVFDVFQLHPAIGSKILAMIRLPIQFLFIYWAWYIWQRSEH